MKYRVRTKDGELSYESFEQLQEAARLGFVEPEDEFQREGEAEWKKVSSQPRLVQAQGRAGGLSPLTRWIILAIAGGAFAFWALAKGDVNERPELYATGLLAAFATVGILFKVTTDAARRRR